MRLLRRLARAQAGYSLIELLTVMVILLTILGGLTTVFVQGTNAELHLNNRFQAQLNAKAALDQLRREVHCASSITPTGASALVTITLPSGCPGGGGTVTWCTVGSGSRYALYRAAGSTCDATGRLYTDYLTTATVFTYSDPIAGTSLAKLHIDLPVSVDPTKPLDTFELVGDIVLRNSLRA